MKKNTFKIAQVVCTFPPYAGGIGNVAANLSDFLSRDNQKVAVITPKYNNIYNDSKKTKYKIIRMPCILKYGNAAILFGIIKQLKNFDIIDLHLPFIGTAGLICIYKRLGLIKAKLIIHYHMDLVGKTLLFRLLFFIQQKAFIPFELNSADAIVISSMDYFENSAIRRLLKKNKSKFKVIPFGIDTKKFYPTKKDCDLLNQYKIGDKKVVLFVGGLDSAHYFKGVNYLLEAFSKLKSKKNVLMIIGKGDLKEQYEQQAKKLQISNRTIFTGFVSDEDLPRYYNLSDVFVFPSINNAEAFGIVLTEAMACGKPTVASNLPGVRTVFGEHQKEISCIPENSDDLAEKIDKTLNNSSLYEKISKENIIRVQKEYTWEIVSSQLDKLYRNLLEPNNK